MDSHPIDPVALISGLFFGLAGFAVFADQQWDDVDIAAFTAAGVMLLGLLLAGLAVVRLIAARNVAPATVGEPASVGAFDDVAPTPAVDATAEIVTDLDEPPATDQDAGDLR